MGPGKIKSRKEGKSNPSSIIGLITAIENGELVLLGTLGKMVQISSPNVPLKTCEVILFFLL